MERGLSLLIAAVMLFVAPGVRAADNLSFANNTVVNITRTGCGVSKLCIETPGNCDPAGNSSCLFASVIAGNTSAPNGTTLSFELSGSSTGYIALGLTVNASQGSTALFVCAQNATTNGTFFFRTMQRNNSVNGTLSAVPTRVTEIRGKVVGKKIQCMFNVPGVNATSARSSETTIFTILLGSGIINGNNLGDFNVTLNSGPLNLADPRANAVTNTTTTPANVTTTGVSGASGALQPHAAALLLSILMLKTA